MLSDRRCFGPPTLESRRVVWIALPILLARVLGAQVLVPRVPLVERFLRDVAVAGGEVVGVMTFPPAPRADVSGLTAFLPATGRSALCVSVSSRDGRYRAYAEYDVVTASPGRYRLTFPTRYRSALEQYLAADTDVAVLAELKDRCSLDDHAEAIVVTAWGSGSSPSSGEILINSLAAQNVEVSGRPCEELTRGDGVAFDWRCVVVLRPGRQTYSLKRHYLDDVKFTTVVVAVP
jgi:hypothetical protein